MKLHELQILLFNCMPQRDPRLLLPRLLNTCSDHGNPWSTPSLDLKMQILSRTAARLALFLALRFRCPLPQGHLRPEPVCVQPGGLPLAAGGRPSGGSFMAEDAPESVGEPPRRRQRYRPLASYAWLPCSWVCSIRRRQKGLSFLLHVRAER